MIPEGTLAQSPRGGGSGPAEIELERVTPNRRQPRGQMTEEALAELADSIREHGILQPLVVRRQGERYELIAGERRLAAAKRAGLRTVPVVVREASEEESLELALIENLQREDINPMEAAEAYQRLMVEFGLTQEQVAERVGKSRAAVANALRLLKLPESIRESLRRGDIEEGHAKVLAGLPSPRAQMRAWQRITRRGLSVKGLAAWVARSEGRNVPRGTILGRPKKPERPVDPNLSDLETELMRTLHARVVIRPQGKRPGGLIEVHYADDDELDRIFWQIVK